jgi:nitroreductase
MVESLLEKAIMAPSGSNLQPWVFISVDDEKICKKIEMFSPGIFGNPACMIVFCIDNRLLNVSNDHQQKEVSASIDVGMAAQTLMWASTAEGIGTCAIKSFQPALVREILKLPDYLSPELIVTMGYPEKIPKTPKRKALSDVMCWNCWKEKSNE